jgi:NAD(P)-dependent dehydrogenase (short-subunit alcohol dehydrogenase family)
VTSGNTGTDKIVLVTGGGRGIGAATARLLAARGYAVCVNYVKNRAAADGVVADIVAGGGRALAVAGDVAVEADVLRLFETVDREMGRLTALVNNAGVLARAARLEDMDGARMTRVFATNILGGMLCAREAVRRMSTKKGGAGGAIVNLSTALTRSGAPNMYVDYAASKGAVETFTVGLAREVAEDGIRVNLVRPGLIDTEIHADGGDPARAGKASAFVPMKRAGKADEVAHAIAWLLSDEASYSTGISIEVSGGV